MEGLPYKMRISVTWDHARQEVGMMLFQVWPIDAESAAVISSNTMQKHGDSATALRDCTPEGVVAVGVTGGGGCGVSGSGEG
eukprot:3348773-Prymnesium_polylepis.1